MKAIWTEEDVIVLLSWLDYCKETDVDFEATITTQLSNARKENSGKEFSFTIIQVKQKFQNMFRAEEYTITMKHVNEDGSAAFKTISKRIKQGITAQLVKYAATSTHVQRNRSGNPRRKAIVVSPAIVQLAEDSEAHSSPKQNMGVQEMQMYLALRREDAASPQTESSSIDTTTQQPLKGNNSKTGEAKLHKLASLHQTTDSAKNRNLEELLEKKNQEISEIRVHWQEEVESLQKREERWMKERKDLMAKVNHLELARDMRCNASAGDPFEQEMYQKNKQIYELENKVQTIQAKMRFISADSESPARVSSEMRSKIDSTMELLQAELECILHGHNMTIPLRAPSKLESNDLARLVRSVCYPGNIQESEESRLRTWVLKFEPDVVIRTLVLAAVQDWVFTSPFPTFAPKDTTLINAYREAVISQDGWRNLHNLEMAAYRSLTESNDFKNKLIPSKARLLARKFSSALAVMFPELDRHTWGSDPLFHKWGESHEVSENRRHRLCSIFEAALRLKAATITAEHDYEFLVYPPGTPHAIHRISSERKLFVHASMQTYARSLSGRRGRMEDALVKSHNFMVKNFNPKERTDNSLSISFITIEEDDNAQSGTNCDEEINGLEVDQLEREPEGMILDSEHEEGNAMIRAASPASPEPMPPAQVFKAKVSLAQKTLVKRKGSAIEKSASPKRSRKDAMLTETSNTTGSIETPEAKLKKKKISWTYPMDKTSSAAEFEHERHLSDKHDKNTEAEAPSPRRELISHNISKGTERTRYPRTETGVGADQQVVLYCSASKDRLPSHDQIAGGTRLMECSLSPVFERNFYETSDMQDTNKTSVKKKTSQEVSDGRKKTETMQRGVTELHGRNTRQRSFSQDNGHEQISYLLDDQAGQQRSELICPRCKKQYLNKKWLESHIKRDSCVKCDSCDLWFHDRYLFDQHYRSKHRIQLKSPSPLREESSKHKGSRHIDTDTAPEPLQDPHSQQSSDHDKPTTQQQNRIPSSSTHLEIQIFSEGAWDKSHTRRESENPDNISNHNETAHALPSGDKANIPNKATPADGSRFGWFSQVAGALTFRSTDRGRPAAHRDSMRDTRHKLTPFGSNAENFKVPHLTPTQNSTLLRASSGERGEVPRNISERSVWPGAYPMLDYKHRNGRYMDSTDMSIDMASHAMERELMLETTGWYEGPRAAAYSNIRGADSHGSIDHSFQPQQMIESPIGFGSYAAGSWDDGLQ